MNENQILIAIGLLCVAIHSLLKAQSLQTDAEKANIPFMFSDYLKKDYLGIGISFLLVFLWLLLFPEVSKNYPKLIIWARVSFGAVAMMGSYIIQLLLSRAKKQIRKIVDVKTDKADGKNQD